jgi:tRNA threonylcarbamoyladenosine biosynthesis protein TsaB
MQSTTKPESVLLALETSGKNGSVAVLHECGGSFVCDMELLPTESGSAKTLAPAIERLMARNNFEMKSLCAIALLTGPGSFTGLRVGVATAKAMAYALRIPTVEIDTLDVIARQCPVVSNSVHAIFDAYRGQIFTAEYSIRIVGESRLIDRVSNTEILDIDVLLDRATKQVQDCQSINLCGPGCDRIRRFLSDPELGKPEYVAEVAGRIRWIDGPESMPKADTVASLGLDKFRTGLLVEPFSLQPRYYRASAAEEVTTKKLLSQ